MLSVKKRATVFNNASCAFAFARADQLEMKRCRFLIPAQRDGVALMDRFSVEWNAHLNYSESLEAAWTDIQSELREGDLLLIIGAGDIEQLADWATQL